MVPNIPYGDRVPLQLGTVQTDMMLDVATEDELQALGMSWLQGELTTRLAGRQNKGVGNSFKLDSVQGDVKFTKNVTFQPMETRQMTCITKCCTHRKTVHVTHDSLEPHVNDLNHEVYMVPTYAELKPGSKRVTVVMHNLSCKMVMFRRGEIVASMTAVNAVP